MKQLSASLALDLIDILLLGPLAIALSIYSSTLGLAAEVAALSLVLAMYFREVRKDITSPLAILFAVYCIYFLPRSIFLGLGHSDFFWIFPIVEMPNWSLVFSVFSYSYFLGHRLPSIRRAARLGRERWFVPTYSFPARRLLIGFSALLLTVAALLFIAYLRTLGGFAMLLEAFSSDVSIFDLNEKPFAAQIKNGMMYSLFAGLILFLSVGDIWPPSRRQRLVLLFVFLLILTSLALLTRRGFILNALLATVIAFNFRVRRLSLTAVLGPALASGFMFFLIYVLRQGATNLPFTRRLAEGFDSAEFWIFDQFVNVVAHAGTLFPFTGVTPFFESLLFFTVPFEQYTSLGRRLVEASSGVPNWGIPPSIVGSAYLVGGIVFLPLVAFALGFTLRLVELFLKQRFHRHPFYLSLYLALAYYLWVLFRLGDPMAAAYSSNRVLLLLVISYAIFLVVGNLRTIAHTRFGASPYEPNR